MFTPKFYHSKSAPYSRMDDYYQPLPPRMPPDAYRSSSHRSSHLPKSSYYSDKSRALGGSLDLRHQLNKTYYQQQQYQDSIPGSKDHSEENKYSRLRDDWSDHSDHSEAKSERNKLKSKRRLKEETS